MMTMMGPAQVVDCADHRHLQALVPVSSCDDALDFFSSRRTNGTNIFREYYDCSCNGDLTTAFELQCKLDKYCFVPWENNSTEAATATIKAKDQDEDKICVRQDATFRFNVTDGAISSVNHDRYCIEYVANMAT